MQITLAHLTDNSYDSSAESILIQIEAIKTGCNFRCISDMRDYSPQTMLLFVKSALFDEDDFPSDVRDRIVVYRDVQGLLNSFSNANTLPVRAFLRRYLYKGADLTTDEILYYRAFRVIPYARLVAVLSADLAALEKDEDYSPIRSLPFIEELTKYDQTVLSKRGVE